MKKAFSFVSAVVAVLLIAGLLLVPASQPALAGVPKILEFNTMVGVPNAYTGAKAPIRGVNGGGVPWVITSGSGELSTTGKLEIKVTGLVIDPAAASSNAGKNPSATFRAIVSCLSVDSLGVANTVNLVTDPFPATTGLAVDGGGNAKFEGVVALPHPCIAPIVFVTNSGGTSWFAATGN